MPLLGQAAMLLNFDIVPDAVAEHDDWHTHEHLPERLAIPGFLRGTRWAAIGDGPAYCVLYEVERLDTLTSAAYLTRLNNPSPWTQKMMPHYRGMSRGLCRVVRSCGLGMGHYALQLRFKPAAGADAALLHWLGDELMPALCLRPGLGSVHLLQSGLTAAMTSEQRIRGADAGVDWALLATGYQEAAVAGLAGREFAPDALQRRGSTQVTATIYRSAYTLTAQEVNGGSGGR